MKNNRGFTLVELLATIVLLALVLSIASYSIITIIKGAKQKNYDLLVKNIESAAELYYQECKYGRNSSITCDENNEVKLGDLVKYGYLKGNAKKNSKYAIINPKNDNDISECTIKINYIEGEVSIMMISRETNCGLVLAGNNVADETFINVINGERCWHNKITNTYKMVYVQKCQSGDTFGSAALCITSNDGYVLRSELREATSAACANASNSASASSSSVAIVPASSSSIPASSSTIIIPSSSSVGNKSGKPVIGGGSSVGNDPVVPVVPGGDVTE